MAAEPPSSPWTSTIRPARTLTAGGWPWSLCRSWTGACRTSIGCLSRRARRASGISATTSSIPLTGGAGRFRLGSASRECQRLRPQCLRSQLRANGPFVGSTKSNKYHYPSCSGAKKIAPANLVTFASSAEARTAGMCLWGYAAHHEKRSSILTFFLEFALVLLSELEYLCCHKARRS